MGTLEILFTGLIGLIPLQQAADQLPAEALIVLMEAPDHKTKLHLNCLGPDLPDCTYSIEIADQDLAILINGNPIADRWMLNMNLADLEAALIPIKKLNNCNGTPNIDHLQTSDPRVAGLLRLPKGYLYPADPCLTEYFFWEDNDSSKSLLHQQKPTEHFVFSVPLEADEEPQISIAGSPINIPFDEATSTWRIWISVNPEPSEWDRICHFPWLEHYTSFYKILSPEPSGIQVFPMTTGCVFCQTDNRSLCLTCPPGGSEIKCPGTIYEPIVY